MKGINFGAVRGSTPVSLLEVLIVIGEPVLDLGWKVEEADFIGSTSSAGLNKLSDDGSTTDGMTLASLAGTSGQMLEGRLVGSTPGSNVPTIVIESIRGDSWDVYGAPGVLERLSRRFDNVQELPAGSGPTGRE